METHGTTYLIYGNEIDFNSQKNPIKRSLKFACFRSIVRLLMLIVVYALAFYLINLIAGDIIGQSPVLTTEIVEQSSEFIAYLILVFTIGSTLFFKFCSLLMGTKTVSISQMAQAAICTVFLILVLPFLNVGYTILLYILLVISPTIKNTNQLIGLSKLRKKRWKPEYLDLYESQKLYDWDIKVTPDSIFSKVKQSQEGKEM